MTHQAQRIAIAEACGAKWFVVQSGEHEGLITKEFVYLSLHPMGFDSEIPDYLNDLNAMHEAEKTLQEFNKSDYCLMICELIQGFHAPNQTWLNSPNSSRVMSVFATAAQRAEAFLRVTGKWVETKEALDHGEKD